MPEVNEIRLGSINGTHGLKGWVKVFSYTDPLEAILDYSPWILRKEGCERKITVMGGQTSGKRLIVECEGCDTRDQAEELIGFEVHVNIDAMPVLEDGEFYWFQLEGLVVKNSRGEALGKIAHMLETGSNDVMVIEPTNDSIDQQKRLIPYLEGDVVKQVDQEIGVVVVDWDSDY
jgi:16S rRNA processing protein RimM